MMLGNFEVWILKFEVRALQRIAPPATRLRILHFTFLVAASDCASYLLWWRLVILHFTCYGGG